jgi:hypothetical protein
VTVPWDRRLKESFDRGLTGFPRQTDEAVTLLGELRIGGRAVNSVAIHVHASRPDVTATLPPKDVVDAVK